MATIKGKVKASTNGVIETFGAAAFKVLSEQVLARTPVGDGTLKSGIIKIGLGVACNYFLPAGPIRRITSTGFIIDGFEDGIYGSGISKMLGGIGGGAQTTAATTTNLI